MKNALFAALPACAMLAGCSTIGGPDPISAPADAFRPIEWASESFATPEGVAEYYLRLEGKSTNLIADQQLGSDPNDRADRILLFSTAGYDDDSVRGEQWRIELDQSDAGYFVTRAGKRYKCYRGPNAGDWQRQLCP